MAWGASSREEFHRIVFSGWGVLAALLFVSSPLLMAFFASQGLNGDGPTALHRGARFAYFAYPLGVADVAPGLMALPVLILVASIAVPARPGMLRGRLAAFSTLAAVAWLAPVVVLGLTFVGVHILAPAFLAFGVLLLELAVWVALGSLAARARGISPLLAAVGIFAALAFISVGADFLVTLLQVTASGLSFEGSLVWRLGLTATSPSTAAAMLRSLLFPGNGGDLSLLEARQADVPAALLSAWTWFAIVALWTGVLLLLARRGERRVAPEPDVEHAIV